MIEYKEGDLLGDNKHKFIKEVESEVRSRGINSKYTISFRKAEFECGLCGNVFTNKIQLIKMGLVKSCGCLKVEKVKAYHSSKRAKGEA